MTGVSDPVEQLPGLGDAELERLLLAVRDELARRRVAAGDIDALVEAGFADGFTERGMPRDPFVRSGLLVCPGARIDQSAMRHECAFVHVGDHWVWDYPDLVKDVVRTLPGPRARMRTVTVLVAEEGLEVDLIVSKVRTGVHQMTQVRSFVIRGGELVLVTARTPRTSGAHR